MLKFTHLTRQFGLFMLIAFPVFTFANGDVKDEKFEQLSQKIEEAIDARNFQDARNALEEIMPLMKEELKHNKKELSDLKKSDEPEKDPTEFERQINRKKELFDSLKETVDISPAALRVKSESIKKDVKEFVSLS
ncbi:MAG: hypothetical protein RIC35_18210 [Marinoscillum sp.]